jgi:hypothetical protein
MVNIIVIIVCIIIIIIIIIFIRSSYTFAVLISTWRSVIMCVMWASDVLLIKIIIT